jgi:hypothetical protein
VINAQLIDILYSIVSEAPFSAMLQLYTKSAKVSNWKFAEHIFKNHKSSCKDRE